MTVRRTHKGGFTLVEILIVVIILGILAAIVIPQFTSASQDARKNSLTSQLQTIRSQLELYKLQHLDKLPTNLIGGTTDWSQLINKSNNTGTTGTATSLPFGPYLQSAPVNSLNGSTSLVVVTTDQNAGAATGSTTAGYVINSNDGKIWGTSAKSDFIFDESNTASTYNDN